MQRMSKEIQRTFGVTDKRFAGHPIEEQAVRNVKKSIKRGVYTASDAIAEAKGYLVSQGCTQDHIEKEMKKVIAAFN